MSRPLLRITGGTVYDPANGIDGQVRDLWLSGPTIVAAPQDPAARPDRSIDASGMVVMPGGIDLHSHIASPKVNMARKLRPDERRQTEGVSARLGGPESTPSTSATGYRYAGLGYTTAFEAAVPPLGARDAHQQLADTPAIDKGCYLLLGNNHFVMDAAGKGESERLKNFVAWLLRATRAYGVKIVNPGGVEMWKQHQAGNVAGLDDPVDGFGVTPRRILQSLAAAVDDLGLPHAVHVHANRLGLPGNWTTTLETMKALDGRRGHLTHIQFHSYGGDDTANMSSQVGTLADYVNAHPNLTVDVGQVLFGPTTSMTGDSPVGYYLHRVYGGKWFSADIEQESGCGIVPIEYKSRSLVHALQWAIGLEWYLRADDPWRIVMSTDHPNGGSFLAYPEIIRLLMDRHYRRDVLKTLPRALKTRTGLAELDRQYTLSEICIITRAAPARILGLTGKGHLGPGADADVTIYAPDADLRAMFELPRWVLKGGEVLVENGEPRAAAFGRTLAVVPSFDPADQRAVETWFNDHYSIRFANFGLEDAD